MSTIDTHAPSVAQTVIAETVVASTRPEWQCDTNCLHCLFLPDILRSELSYDRQPEILGEVHRTYGDSKEHLLHNDPDRCRAYADQIVQLILAWRAHSRTDRGISLSFPPPLSELEDLRSALKPSTFHELVASMKGLVSREISWHRHTESEIGSLVDLVAEYSQDRKVEGGGWDTLGWATEMMTESQRRQVFLDVGTSDVDRWWQTLTDKRFRKGYNRVALEPYHFLHDRVSAAVKVLVKLKKMPASAIQSACKIEGREGTRTFVDFEILGTVLDTLECQDNVAHPVNTNTMAEAASKKKKKNRRKARGSKQPIDCASRVVTEPQSVEVGSPKTPQEDTCGGLASDIDSAYAADTTNQSRRTSLISLSTLQTEIDEDRVEYPAAQTKRPADEDVSVLVLSTARETCAQESEFDISPVSEDGLAEGIYEEAPRLTSPTESKSSGFPELDDLFNALLRDGPDYRLAGMVGSRMSLEWHGERAEDEGADEWV